jgi:hypothetical protein
LALWQREGKKLVKECPTERRGALRVKPGKLYASGPVAVFLSGHSGSIAERCGGWMSFGAAAVNVVEQRPLLPRQLRILLLELQWEGMGPNYQPSSPANGYPRVGRPVCWCPCYGGGWTFGLLLLRATQAQCFPSDVKFEGGKKVRVALICNFPCIAVLNNHQRKTLNFLEFLKIPGKIFNCGWGAFVHATLGMCA